MLSFSSCLIVMTNIITCFVSKDVKWSWLVIRAICILAGVFKDIFNIFFLSQGIPGIRYFKFRTIKEGFGRRGIKVGFHGPDNIGIE